jgi:hypothetical protein
MYSLAFSNGTIIDDSNDDIYSISLSQKTDSSKLTFGTVSSCSLSLKLNNVDKRFDKFNFKEKYINVYINDTKKYKIYVDDIKKKNGFIQIEGYDKIKNLNEKFKGCTFPISIYSLVILCLKQCGLTMGNTIPPNFGLVLHENVSLTGLTCREVISYCLELCGGIGLLDEDEKFIIKWFDTSETKTLDTNTFISYSSDEDDITFNNIRYIRNGRTYNSNQGDIINSLYLTSDNPLLMGSSSDKIQEVIENLQEKSLTYFPCSIQLSSIEKYSLGDCVKFVDEDGNEKLALVCNITIKNLTSVTINSLSIDLTTSEGDDDDDTTTTMSQNDELYFYKNNVARIDYVECADNAEIEYILNVNIEDAFDDVRVMVNNALYKSYNVYNGNNTITLMLKGDIIETTTTIDIETDNTLQDIEANTLYRYCQIIDYSEDDDFIYVEEEEIDEPDNISGTYQHANIEFGTGIQGWYYCHFEVNTYDDNYQVIGNDVTQLGIKSYNDNITYECNDDFNLPELYTKERIDLYNDMCNSTFYVKLTFDYTKLYYEDDSDKVIKEEDITGDLPDGTFFVYKKKMSGESNYKWFKSSTGIVKVDKGTSLIVYSLTQNNRSIRTSNETMYVAATQDEFELMCNDVFIESGTIEATLATLDEYNGVKDVKFIGFGFTSNSKDLKYPWYVNYIENYDDIQHKGLSYGQYGKTISYKFYYSSTKDSAYPCLFYRRYADEGYEIIKTIEAT